MGAGGRVTADKVTTCHCHHSGLPRHYFSALVIPVTRSLRDVGLLAWE